jgi:hypothetical protein
MIDTTLLVAWRAWYARNEATHDKLLLSIEGSKRFLCNYLKLTRDIKDKPTVSLLKGKSPVVATGFSPGPIQITKAPDKTPNRVGQTVDRWIIQS